MATETTIVLKTTGQHEEYPAEAAILPGQVCEMIAGGTVQVLGTDNQLGSEKMIAKEDALQGKTITQAYAADDIVGLQILHPGDVVLLLCLTGQDIPDATKLAINDAGKGVIVDGSDVQVFGVALEDTDGALGADALVKVRVT